MLSQTNNSESEMNPTVESKKNFWKFVVQTAINILAAVLTALGATSCVSTIA